MIKNLLAKEISPYLLQHKDNPVHWRAWNNEALQAARIENKPILVSIGYAACHWCHVMAHESFEDPETAKVMNEFFINIKVDREERPDIDKIYMNAIHLMGQQGGWPLTMFLTPDGYPFWGGTYFPKKPAYGQPSFIQVLTQIAQIHRTQPDKVKLNSDVIKLALGKRIEKDDTQNLSPGIADQVAHQLLQQIDLSHGGLKGAPKFPQTIILDLLWRAGCRLELPEFHDAVILSLTHMCQGGIYDHLGGGFSRYSVDDRWLVPNFEKMLYDNALIMDLLIRAYQVTAEPLFRQRIKQTIQWVKQEMITGEGAFAASLDADSEGIEGRFYVWTAQEIHNLLDKDFDDFAQIYDVSTPGNWEGLNILNRLNSLHLENHTLEERLNKNRNTLLEHRNTRIRPGLDDKILSDWNGLMISTLSQAAVTFKNPEWLDWAQNAYHYIIDNMIIEGQLCHAARSGKIQQFATSEDYANLIRASLCLYQATDNRVYLKTALELNAVLYKHYWDNDEGGYYFTSDSAENLIIRSRSATDDATPNANGIMAQNLIKLYLFTGNQDNLDRVDHIISAFTAEIFQNIFNCASLLVAFDMRIQLLSVVLVPGQDKTDTHNMTETVREYLPASATFMIARPGTSPGQYHPASDKCTINSQPVVYICRNTTCGVPLTAKGDIIAALTAL